MIEETCVRIEQLEVANAAEIERRYARRTKIRHIDDIINDLEMLNLAEETEMPRELRVRMTRLVLAERHPIVSRAAEDLTTADWMEALYDVQDTLMLPMEDEVD